MRRFFLYGFLIFFLLIISACKKDLQQDFSKIQPGMTYNQVVGILGKPSEVNSITIDGFSGTSATWRNQNIAIIVEFINDKVQIKAITNNNSKDQGNS